MNKDIDLLAIRYNALIDCLLYISNIEPLDVDIHNYVHDPDPDPDPNPSVCQCICEIIIHS